MILKAADIKKYASINGNIPELDMNPSIRTAELDYIAQEIGLPFYNELDAAFNADATLLNAAQKNIMNTLYQAIAFFTVKDALPMLMVQISSMGLNVTFTDHTKPLLEWQMEKLDDFIEEKGYMAIDRLLAYMEANVSSYPTWASSPAFTLSNQFFINSTDDFNNYYFIGRSRRTFRALWPAIAKAENYDLTNFMGQPFFAAIKADANSGSPAATTTAILPMIKGAIAAQAMYYGYDEMAVAENRFGVNKSSSNSKSTLVIRIPLSGQEQADFLIRLKRGVELHLENLRNYLDANASETVYPLWFASAAYSKPGAVDAIFTNKKHRKYYIV